MSNQATQSVRRPTKVGAQLKVTRYDRVASLLIALLTLVGTAVFCLFVIWLTNQIYASQTAVPVVIQEIGGGSEDGVVGESMELDAPDAEVIEMEAAFDEPQVQDTLELVADALATQQAELEDPLLADFDESGRRSGRSTGDGRQVGFGQGPGESGISRADRWEVLFSDGQTLNEYARQLDFFGIELGVVTADRSIDYVSRLAQETPVQRRGRADDESRLFMSWSQGNLRDADRELMARGGVEVGQRRILQFYPAETESQLAGLERSYAGREPSEIRKTRFAVQATRDGFQFFVLDQSYL